MSRRRSFARAAVVAAAAASIAVVAPALAQDESTAAQSQTQQGSPEAQSATVVSSKRVVPRRRKVFRHRFRPWAKPSPRQVREIIRIESRRYGIHPSRLARRIHCESRFRWNATSAYYGLLQFAPSTFQRGMRSIRTRKVVLRRERVRTVRTAKITRWSDGRRTTKRGSRRKQRVIHIYEGRIPRNPSVYHGWAPILTCAQAIRGKSAVHSAEWGCPA